MHITLLYPQLGKADTVSPFQMNMDRLKTIEEQRFAITNEPKMTIEENRIIDFAIQHFDNFSHAGKADCRWNWRQIRNASQIASSLARYEHFVNSNSNSNSGGPAGETGSRGLYLGARHFKQVEKATVEYDEFRTKMLGATDAEIARSKSERGPDVVRHAGPQQGSAEARRRVGSPSLQRHTQPTPMVPLARDRGGTPTGQRGGGSGRPSPGYDAGFSTPRQQTARGSPASFHAYGSGSVDADWEHDGGEAGDQGFSEEHDLDDTGHYT